MSEHAYTAEENGHAVAVLTCFVNGDRKHGLELLDEWVATHQGRMAVAMFMAWAVVLLPEAAAHNNMDVHEYIQTLAVVQATRGET